jgi:hypothetical protein
MLFSILINTILLFNILLTVSFQEENFNIRDLGKGTIHLKDDRTFSKIQLVKIEESWIIYEKNRTLHDLAFEKINYLDFPNAKQGKVKIRFEEDNKTIKIIQQ